MRHETRSGTSDIWDEFTERLLTTATAGKSDTQTSTDAILAELNKTDWKREGSKASFMMELL